MARPPRTSHDFRVLVEKDADGWHVASVPALRGCHTQAKSLDVLMKRVREAVELCLEVERPASGQRSRRRADRRSASRGTAL